MRKWIRIALIVFGSLLGVLIILWLGLAWYIRLHKTELLHQISDILNDRLHGGQLTIKNMEPSLVRSFPAISVSLQDVTVKDSLWEQHHHSLLEVSHIFIKVNTLALLRKKLDIKQVSLEKGTIYLFTDTTGYTNTSVLKRKAQGDSATVSGRSQGPDITGLQFVDMHIVLDNREKGKLFDFAVDQLKGKLRNNDSGWVFSMHTELIVKSLAFNTDRGSFLKNRKVETSLDIEYNRLKKTLYIPQQGLEIDGQPISAGAKFNFDEQSRQFNVHIVAEKVLLSQASSWLTPRISEKLDSIHIERPLDAEFALTGYMRYRDLPLVNVTWKTKDNKVITKGMELDECSFDGSFTNEWVAGQPRTDDNSIISLYSLKAHCYGIPVMADTVHITNLRYPALTGYFKSEFPLTDLNNASDSNGVFNFTAGTAKAKLYYKGGIAAGDTITPFLKGTVQLTQGAMEYTPRNLKFKNCNATLDFTGQDLYLKDIHIQTQKSSLLMDGSVRNITNLYFTAPEKLQLDWNVRSPMVDLDEFRSFLGKRKSGVLISRAANRRKTNRIVNQLNVMLNSCNVNLQVLVDKVSYSNFTAQQVKADLALSQEDILLRKISLLHAGGSIQLNGVIKQAGGNNRFKINTDISNVHIDQLFYAFNDFGMKSLSSKNLKGIMSAKADISGNIKDNGVVAPQSMFGTLNFDLREAALIHFTPIEDIGDVVFRKRNLGNITFDNLKNTLTLQGNKILIPPMQINSSALYMDVTGVYGITTGTDLYVDVPLRNPSKDDGITDMEKLKKNRRRGIILHLHATDDGNGKVKIKLGGKGKPEPEKDKVEK
ncbi:AsmA family protein [Chitinophaga sp. CF118]|uniref:AsmA family protein n=1 Tax=Chitinophaga sp. CF118 TaxID=1884367 RepID=UPI0008E7E3A8|nr:AsmA family protein [Chitinophaga sp. CF118]SFE53751.1 AsmA family protein [Chitinophaga sp. CF118]